MTEQPHRAPPLDDERFVRRVAVVAAFVALGATIYVLSDLLLLVFGAVLVAVLLHAISAPLSDRVGVGRRWAIALACLCVLAVLGIGGYIFGAQVGQQFDELTRRLPDAVQKVAPGTTVESVTEFLKGSSVGAFVAQVISWASQLVSAMTGLVVVVIGGVFFASDPDVYRNGFIKLFPPRIQPEISATVDEAGKALRRWISAQLLAMLIVGLMSTLGYWLIGLPSPLALGFISGLTEFVPYLGPIAGAAPAVLLAASSDQNLVIATIAVAVIVQQVENNVLIPLLAGQVVRMPAALGLFAVIAMGTLFGPLGLLFSFPLAVVINTAVQQLYIGATLGQPVEAADKAE